MPSGQVTAYPLRIHIGLKFELVFFNNRLLQLRKFQLASGSGKATVMYGPMSLDPLQSMSIPDNAASYKEYPLRIYITKDKETNVSYGGRPISAIKTVDLTLETDTKRQMKFLSAKQLPQELEAALLDLGAEIHNEGTEDASL